MTNIEFGIDIDWFPSPRIVALQLDHFGMDIRSYREPLQRAVQEVMAPSIGENFEVGGRPSWDQLSEFTIAKKGHDTILVDSGALERIAQQLNVWTINRYEAYINDLPGAEYGFFHQSGFTNARTGRDVPARQFLLIQPEDEEAIVELFEEWIQERLLASGF